MEGYLWKKRYFQAGNKKGVLRKRYVILDEDSEVLHFKVSAEEPKIHKSLPLDQIAEVMEYGDHGFILSTRHVCTAEVSGADFLFEVELDDPDGKTAKRKPKWSNESELRNQWVKLLKNKVNGRNNGLGLVIRNYESIHLRYDIASSTPSSVLGTGMSGDVRLISRRVDGKHFAMKTVLLANVSPTKVGNLRREIDILKAIDHPHIARLQETFFEPKMYCRMVIELCEGGELFHRLHKRNYFSERYAKKLIKKMLKALNYLHINNVVHRDLKLENWLFRNKEYYAPCERNNTGLARRHCSCSICEDDDIALIDFGLSRKFRSKSEVMTKQLGTSYYIAPEVLKGNYRGNDCDMWSLGVISFMLLSGRAPFDAEKDDEISSKVLNEPLPNIDNPRDKNARWHSISKEGRDFVKELLTKDPEARLTTERALGHPWIAGTKDLFGLSGSKCSESVLENTRSVTIDNAVIERLRSFTRYKEFKRLAMEVIAFSLDHKEIKELTDLFEEIDQDSDGYITFEELLKALQETQSLEEKEIKEMFNALDEERNGRIHVNEFVAGTLQTKYHMEERFLAQAFTRMDVGQKGRITLKDLRALLGRCATEERINDIWHQSGLVRKNEGDEISFKDFMKFMRTDGEKNVTEYRRSSLPDSRNRNARRAEVKKDKRDSHNDGFRPASSGSDLDVNYLSSRLTRQGGNSQSRKGLSVSKRSNGMRKGRGKDMFISRSKPSKRKVGNYKGDLSI